MRLLYLPIEGFVGDQGAPRAAFESMRRSGRLHAYDAYSFLCRARELGSWQKMLGEFYALAKAFAPDAIFWELQTAGRVPPEFSQRLKNLPSRPIIAQRTGDSYWKPPRNMIEFGREIDVTLLTTSTLIPDFQEAGCKDVRLLPERLDTIRFGKPWQRTSQSDFDVVLIANNYRQFWFRRYPGQTDRLKLVKAFSRTFGRRFGLFGGGWENEASWQGAVPYAQQQEVMRRANLILSVNNWNQAHYFSDRLLNSLSSGVPVLQKHFEGADEFFTEDVHLWYFEDVDEAVPKARKLLQMDDAARQKVAKVGAAEAVAKHSCEVRAEQLLQILDELRVDSRRRLHT